MTEGWPNTVSSTSARAVRFVVRQPSWLTRAALIAAILVFMLVFAFVIIPALIIGALVYGLGAVSRRAFGRMKAPNGALDGRRNVRVIVRE